MKKTSFKQLNLLAFSSFLVFAQGALAIDLKKKAREAGGAIKEGVHHLRDETRDARHGVEEALQKGADASNKVGTEIKNGAKAVAGDINDAVNGKDLEKAAGAPAPNDIFVKSHADDGYRAIEGFGHVDLLTASGGYGLDKYKGWKRLDASDVRVDVASARKNFIGPEHIAYVDQEAVQANVRITLNFSKNTGSGSVIYNGTLDLILEGGVVTTVKVEEIAPADKALAKLIGFEEESLVVRSALHAAIINFIQDPARADRAKRMKEELLLVYEARRAKARADKAKAAADAQLDIPAAK